MVNENKNETNKDRKGCFSIQARKIHQYKIFSEELVKREMERHISENKGTQYRRP